jgi:hypothetical protein
MHRGRKAVTKNLFYAEERKVKSSPWQEYSFNGAQTYMACSQGNHYYSCSFHTVSVFLPILLLHPDLQRASGFNWPACSQSFFSISFTK